MVRPWHRREMLKEAGTITLGLALGCRAPAAERRGVVVGHAEGAKAGNDVLAAGGNAVDAAVAAALVAGVVGVHNCGIGGYGGHLVIALPGGKKVTAIDFNSAAPAAARPDMYPLDAKGQVKGGINANGWLAAGVPGTLAGLQLALDRYGTRPFGELVRPVVRYAREGFPVGKGMALALRSAQAHLRKDPGSARLFFPNGEPLPAGATYRNPDLANLLQELAEQNSVESFYRGPIARRIAEAFQKNGGLVTEKDMAAYRAREVEPLELTWKGNAVYTAPLTAGGLTLLEALSVLHALGWDRRPADDPRTEHARLEALRCAWHDRLRYLGDPAKAKVDWQRLLTPRHAEQLAKRVEQAVKDGKPAPAETDGRGADGTIHLSAADGRGMLVALTLTHGAAFGARVTVEGLGLLLGHGMSRFDPHPGHPNAPGPGKRPLHNMCPTVVLRGGQPVLAVGGTGGRRIPNSVFDVLCRYAGRGASIRDAVAAWRMHTEGGLDVTVEPRCPAEVAEYFRKVGYAVKRGPGATIHAVAFDPAAGTAQAASR